MLEFMDGRIVYSVSMALALSKYGSRAKTEYDMCKEELNEVCGQFKFWWFSYSP